MEQFKRAQVIMLPTKQLPTKGILLKRHLWKNEPNLECNSLWRFNEDVIIGGVRQFTTLNGSFRDIYTSFKAQHLYITSDDEIKEGDWCYDKSNNRTVQIIYKHKDTKSHYFVSSNINSKTKILSEGYSLELEELKKIIATTDRSLQINTYYKVSGVFDGGLPLISQQFIEKYIESYNKDEVIIDVLVEYSPSSITIQTYSGQQVNDNLKALILKINPKDNTITIKKLKDSWNREEVIKLLKSITYTEFQKLPNWIEENL